MSTATPLETLVIGPEHNGMRMTPEEFDAATEWDENHKYELVHGVLIVTPPPLEQERDPNEELGHWLRDYRDRHPRGGSLDATLSEHHVRSTDSRRRADRVIWAGLGRRPDPRRDVPTIVVEFLSEGRRSWRRDYVEKRDEYLGLGVKEYWLIDRFRRIMTVFRPASQPHVVQEGDVYRTGLLPGFELPLAKLLSLADRWESTE
ncbi:MAG: Uma2 family endonuclease [Planctomycetaceae bacterium]